MVQRPYTQDAAVGLAGGISATGGEQRVVSYRCVANVEPGTALSFTANGDVTPVGGGSLAFAGIAINTSVGSSEGGDTYQNGDLVPVMDRGSVWCTLTGATAAAVGGAVYRTLATGAITALSTGNTLIPNARFESTGSAGDLVDVRLG